MSEKQSLIAVYSITNKLNQKIYIGSSSNYVKRFHDHIKALKENTHYNFHLRSSWNKYGEDNFVFDVVELLPSDYTKEEQFAQEQVYLDKFKSYERNLGYNISKIAFGCTGMLGKTGDLNKKSIQVYQYDISGKFIARWANSTVAASSINGNRRNIAACCLNKREAADGFLWSYEKTDLLCRNPRRKRIVQMDLENNVIKTWESPTHAKKELNFSGINTIILCCENKRKTAFKFKWKFEIS